MDDLEFEALLSQMREMYLQLSKKMQEKWQRDLPLDELLFDRWERARRLGFGDNTSIYHNSYVFGNVKVGHSTWIGPFTILDGSGDLIIGNYCSISSGVHIYTHDTVHFALSGGSSPIATASTSIGNNCYVGSQTVIAKGVSIGDYVVIGANSFVNRDIPSNTIAFGNPCRKVGRIELVDQEINIIYD